MGKSFRFFLVSFLVASLIIPVAYRKADAVAPAVPLMAIILSSVATGSAIGYMAYNANGKQIFLKTYGAMKDGAQVTKDWVRQEIAKINGLDIEYKDKMIYPIGVDYKYIDLDGLRYKASLTPFQRLCLSDEGDFVIAGWTGGVVTGINVKVGICNLQYGPGALYESYHVSLVGSTPGFNPADHPYLYDGPALLTNCHAVAKAHPDLVPLYDISDVKPDGFDEANSTVQEIGGYTNGYVTDAQGNKYDLTSILSKIPDTYDPDFPASSFTYPNGTVQDIYGYVPPASTCIIGDGSLPIFSGNYVQSANGTKIYISDIISKNDLKITAANGTVFYASKDSGPKAIDSTGNIIHMPPGDVLDRLGGAKPSLDWTSYSDSYISTSTTAIPGETPNGEKGKKLLPAWLGNRLKQAGIDTGSGSVIDSVSNGRVNWTDSAGVSHTTLVNTELTDALVRAGAAQRVTTRGRTTTIQNAQSTVINNAGAITEAPSIDFGPDPGNPSDASLPDIPLFDPTMDWGEEEPWPWADWVGALPFVDVLKSSSINLSGANPVVSFELSILGTSRAIPYDFSKWNFLLNSMGIIIYACACWYALQLALLKRD